MTPKLIVCCAAFNEEAYLNETLPAMLNQGVDVGYLLIDNGSTDSTWQIMLEWARHRDNVGIMRLHENHWPGDAAHVGLGRAFTFFPDTRWFLGQGADDLMLPGYLQAILDCADANPDANCIYSPWTFIDHPEKGVQRFPDYDPKNVCGPTVPFPGWRAITRDLWESVGGEDKSIRIGADWDMLVRASVQGVLRPVQLDQPYLAIRIRPSSRLSQSQEVNWNRLNRHLLAHRKDNWASWGTPG